MVGAVHRIRSGNIRFTRQIGDERDGAVDLGVGIYEIVKERNDRQAYGRQCPQSLAFHLSSWQDSAWSLRQMGNIGLEEKVIIG